MERSDIQYEQVPGGLALSMPSQDGSIVPKASSFCQRGRLLECVFDRMPVGLVILDRDYCIQHFNAIWAAFAMRYFDKVAAEVCPDRSFFEIVPGSEAAFVPLFQRVLAGETIEIDNFRLEVDAIESHWNVVLVPLVEGGAAVGIIVMASDVTRRNWAEDQAREAEIAAQTRAFQFLEQRVEERTREIERRRRVAEGLRDILAALNSNRPLQIILDSVVAQASRTLGADIVAIYQLGVGDQLAVQASYGLSPDEIAVMTLSIGQSASGQTVMRRIPIIMATESTEFRDVIVRQKMRVAPEQWPILDDMVARIKTLLAVPLAIKDEIYGAVGLYFCVPRTFSDEEIDLTLAFADQAALAIENARLRERAERAAVVEERGRLARDLHDSVTQSLYSLTLFAEAAHRVASFGDAARTTQFLERVSSTARQALKEMRLLVHELRPLALEHDGLIGALQQRLDAVEGRAGIQARLLVEGDIALPVVVESELYHIAQEALNNALNHAAASTVVVRLSCQMHREVASATTGCARQIRLEVSDNGCGFDPDHASEHGGLGLISLRERAARLGGEVHICSTVGQGTTVIVDCRLQIANCGNPNLRSAI
jgi:signal transduction histidine kinase